MTTKKIERINEKKVLKQKKKNNEQLKVRQIARKKEVQIYQRCHELISDFEQLQTEISKYPKGTFPEKKRMDSLLKELTIETQICTLKMERLATSLESNSRAVREAESNPPKKQVVVEEKKGWIQNLLFYTFLLVVFILLGTFLNGQSESGLPKNISGYSPMTVLTKSMQRVYPKHSLVVTKVTDPKTLKIGDDVTYIKENNTTVTHRIVGINENYMDTRERGFETKGVENPRKDEEIVRGENIIGKVVYSNLLLGEILLFVRENMLLTAITAIIGIYFIDALIKQIANYRRNRQKGARK